VTGQSSSLGRPWVAHHKGIALVRLANGHVRKAELHWYEAHGIGKRELKRKGYLD